MTREEAIREACSIFSLVYSSLNNYDRTCDCFCDQGVISRMEARDRALGLEGPNLYRNDGHIFEWVRQAVLEKLRREGTPVGEGYHPETGKQVPRSK